MPVAPQERQITGKCDSRCCCCSCLGSRVWRPESTSPAAPALRSRCVGGGSSRSGLGGGESQQRRARRTPHPDPEAASPLRAAAPPGPISLSERGSGSKRPPAARAGARRNLGLAPAGRRTTRCLNTPFPQAELQRRLDAEKPRNHLDLRHRLDKHGKRYGKVRCGARLRRVVAGTARTRTQQRRAACCSCRTAAAVPGRSMHADQ